MKALFTVLFSLLIANANSQSKNFLDQSYLEVNGSADTSITPNEIFIRILVTERDTKDKASVEELEVKMVSALKAMGIDVDSNLTTSDMVSNFRFYLLKSKDVLKSKQYMLKVTNAVTASKVFIQLEELGISNVSIDRVSHSNLEGIKNLMRTRAMENARARGIALTKPINQSIGPAIHIADNETYNANQQIQGRLAGVMVTGYATKVRASEELPNIEFEKIRVSTNINVKFVLR